MAVTNKGSSITMTANADATTRALWIAGLTFQCSGASIGDRLLVTDTGGDIIADYLVMAATDNADLWGGRQPHFYQGLTVSAFPSGAGVLTIILE